MITKHLCVIDSVGNVKAIYRAGSQIEMYDGLEEDGYLYKYGPEGVDDLSQIIDEYYWDDGWCLRPQSGVALEGLTLKNVHAGSDVNINGQPQKHSGGDLELNITDEGYYTIQVVKHPYLIDEFHFYYNPEDSQ